MADRVHAADIHDRGFSMLYCGARFRRIRLRLARRAKSIPTGCPYDWEIARLYMATSTEEKKAVQGFAREHAHVEIRITLDGINGIHSVLRVINFSSGNWILWDMEQLDDVET